MTCLAILAFKIHKSGAVINSRLLYLSERVLAGDRNSVSKAITVVENGQSASLMRDLYPRTGHAHIIGVTGPLGTGKSSLVDQLVKAYRGQGKKVAVLAVDPSSPLSGGAILGDRVRMLEHSLDPGVYIRSMASRGDQGGLSHATKDAVRVLDAGGFDVIFVETVGIGQTEVEVVDVADSVVVVLMPELGDEIQAAKAGLIEIGDIFAVNKSDLPGADKVIYNLGSMLAPKLSGWQQIVIKVSAKSTEGISELAGSINDHREFLKKSGTPIESTKRLEKEVIQRVETLVLADLETALPKDPDFISLRDKLVIKQIDPDGAARELARKYISNKRDLYSKGD
jgi:LAO/AO transport system kinase